MKRVLILSFILTAGTIFFLSQSSFAMESKNFDVYEKMMKNQGDFKILAEVTLNPGEEKTVSAYSFKPLTIDFKTALSKKDSSKCKNEGIGIKKLAEINYYLKDPLGASMDVLPEDGTVHITVKNFEKFPITLKLYKKDFKRT